MIAGESANQVHCLRGGQATQCQTNSGGDCLFLCEREGVSVPPALIKPTDEAAESAKERSGLVVGEGLCGWQLPAVFDSQITARRQRRSRTVFAPQTALCASWISSGAGWSLRLDLSVNDRFHGASSNDKPVKTSVPRCGNVQSTVPSDG